MPRTGDEVARVAEAIVADAYVDAVRDRLVGAVGA